MPFGAYGLRRLQDAQQNFAAAGLPVYLRIKNFEDNPVVEELGFTFVPTVTGDIVNTGTQDLLISPPPVIKMISMHSLAMAQNAGVQLRAGARKVTISHSWVLARQTTLDYRTPQEVFNKSNIVGLVSDNLLFEVVDMVHQDAFGEIINWILTCNTSELSRS